MKPQDNQLLQAKAFTAPTGRQTAQPLQMTISHWLLILAGLLAIAFIIFITLAKSIQFVTVTEDLQNPQNTLPVEARVRLLSGLKLPIGNRVLVLSGQHTVQVEADGFQPFQQTVLVESDKQQQFELQLIPLPGKLKLSVLPEAVIASVSSQGQLWGDSAGLIEDIAAGLHEITIDAPLYRPTTMRLLVRGKQVVEELQVELEPAWGTLTVDTVPDQAQLWLDGKLVGSTPTELKVEEGTRQIELRKDKFKPYQMQLNMIAQQTQNVPVVELIPADGVLNISSKPDGSAVIVNGEYKGLTPIKVALKPNVESSLQVYQAGYKLFQEQLSLAPEQIAQRQVALRADLIPVRFSVSPASAKLYVDGQLKGSGTQTLNLSSLPHRIQVKHPGYVSAEQTLIPTRASSQVVSIRLLTREEHFWKNVPASYTTDAGQTMKLFKSPGRVLMGSSRRETGRRSNEAVYTAQLSKHFYISEHEVTNKQYRQFKPSHTSGNYKRKSLDGNRQPVVNISWQDAARYCNWLSIKEGLQPFYVTKAGYISSVDVNANGYRLPTEVEWAWLARNRDGKVKTFPWDQDPTTLAQPVGNFADTNAVEFIAFTLAGYDDGYKASAPVGKFPANHRGLYDMAGNVSEWINDWYSANSDLIGKQDLLDPLGPQEGEFHVIRGGSWAKGHKPQLRLAYRDFAAKGKYDVGFRVARYVGKPQ